MAPKADCGPEVAHGEAEGEFMPALGGPAVPDLRRVPKGEVLSCAGRGSSLSCDSSCRSVRRRRRAGGGVFVAASSRKVLFSVGESGPFPANESLVSRRRTPGRDPPEVLTMDREVFRAPALEDWPSFGLFNLSGELTDVVKF